MKDFLKSLTKQQKKNIVIGFVVLLVGYFIYKAYKKRQYTNVPFDQNNIPVINTGINGGNVIKWSPEPLAREIFEKLEGYNWNIYPDTASKVLDLNDDQTKFLYNYYNQYLASDEPTLTKLFAGEWGDYTGKYNEVVAKLKALGLE